ncbi:LysR family transcriptional regulator [Paenibacillus xanthanilyticus]|uniref:LysR family transcriptional regulator n=1 Tax=Paenibacillus xanthanilyticus TaxID=1783531 RepID=A0ABV8K104_9BACL
MELLQLHYFRVVAQHEHMTKAAEALNIAQPSLSKTIARLEEHVGVPLFERQGRSIRLNAYGGAYLKRVERIFAELDAGKREVLDMAGLASRSVLLAASISNVLPELLSAFLEKHPQTHFRQVLEPTAVMQRMLEDGEIDLCLTSASIEGEGLEWRALRTDAIVLCVPEHHRLAGRERVSLLELKGEPFIGQRAGYWFRDLTDQICRKAGFQPNTIIEVEESDAIVNLFRRGIGLIFLPEMSWSKRAHLLPNRLYVDDAEFKITMGLAWSKRHYMSTAALEFRQFVMDYYAGL